MRIGRSQDGPAILKLWDVSRSTHASTPDRLEDLERLLCERPGGLLVAESGSTIVGALIAAWDGWRGNMYRLAVLPASRRHGVAMKLARIVQ